MPHDGAANLNRETKRALVTNSESETESLGEEIGRQLSGGDVVALRGELGAGKTCLVRGIARGLGSSSHVKSPTFTIINRYYGRFPVYHFDLYRVEGCSSLEELGCQDFFGGDGVVLIEWGEKAGMFLPEDRLEIDMKFLSETKREIDIRALGRMAERFDR